MYSGGYRYVIRVIRRRPGQRSEHIGSISLARAVVPGCRAGLRVAGSGSDAFNDTFTQCCGQRRASSTRAARRFDWFASDALCPFDILTLPHVVAVPARLATHAAVSGPPRRAVRGSVCVYPSGCLRRAGGRLFCHPVLRIESSGYQLSLLKFLICEIAR